MAYNPPGRPGAAGDGREAEPVWYGSGADAGLCRIAQPHGRGAAARPACPPGQRARRRRPAGGARRLVEFGRDWCAAQGVRAPEFNLGGGMAVDYARPDALFGWAGYGRGLARLARDGETLRIEPGRAVTAYCGWYLTRVLAVNRSHGEAFAVVAGGTHHLRTPAAKGHDQPCAVISVPDWTAPWPRPGVC